MKLEKYIGLLAILVLCVGCGNDDDDGGPEVIPVRDRAEQSVEDDVLIREYLQTHFYNYEEFEAAGDEFDYVVRIDTISGDNSGKTPILNRPELKTYTYDLFDASNTLYVLMARDGGTPNEDIPQEIAATYTDSIFMEFTGSEIEGGNVFDATANPIWLNLPATINGFARGLENFKGDPDGATINDDGTVTFNNFGSGVVFVPSGLGYFNQPPSNIGFYASIMFNFQTFQVKVTDHDGDLIPTIREDINANKFLFDDVDNTDGDAAFDFRDPDDDNDGVRTRLEIMTTMEENEEGEMVEVFSAFLDTDNDGTPDHLDTDDDGDGRETIDEIAINPSTGVVTYTDTDGDGTPDYLDSDS